MGHTAGREQGLAVALDIGGTKTAAAVVSDRGEILGSATMATRDGDVDPLARMERLVVQAAGPVGLDRVSGLGISSAGPVDLASGTVAPVNIPELRGLPLLERMAALVPGRPARLLGDGLAAAAGEHWIGAGRGCEDLLAIVVSTGVGGGFVLRGRLHGGASGNAGHVGHAPVVIDGEPCPCGGAGCPEVYASGPSMVAFAVRNGWRTDARADGEALAQAARRGEPAAVLAFERGAGALAAMIAAAAATCDVRRVIVGGGVAGAGAVLMDPLRRSLGRYLSLAFLAGLEVVPAGLGARASLVGAAAAVHRPDRYALGEVTASVVRSSPSRNGTGAVTT
ncbi:ROK family protein [Catenulispora acidiphila DSM 44928]|uniref:ROK family protein n=1 Tax=Catenulispora acidiphila (strain DSM 44928 / JCM 14897 / NBRC 102108 / NRRL B-24433 / ID139908) TaxID=479433 RepID=C7PZC2_CATAD|nr:ROK family protein [Catenulispora acidiphila]ACU71579.1 ROK family protein [Catenulispora acidiphila DSM 44928]